ncbi:hypothetical protein HK105_203650 [Polyrhizophydium stewartii]|uniref:Uncharacterized protein n=1 Tax=Polyrhizophydium stewartii TaxID=2732419 RepID=A0ABR4NBF7_9FUNG|nr:hypothetical protein HK105_007620 [Polyrhizophydium stewartii]
MSSVVRDGRDTGDGANGSLLAAAATTAPAATDASRPRTSSALPIAALAAVFMSSEQQHQHQHQQQHFAASQDAQPDGPPTPSRDRKPRRGTLVGSTPSLSVTVAWDRHAAAHPPAVHAALDSQASSAVSSPLPHALADTSDLHSSLLASPAMATHAPLFAIPVLDEYPSPTAAAMSDSASSSLPTHQQQQQVPHPQGSGSFASAYSHAAHHMQALLHPHTQPHIHQPMIRSKGAAQPSPSGGQATGPAACQPMRIRPGGKAVSHANASSDDMVPEENTEYYQTPAASQRRMSSKDGALGAAGTSGGSRRKSVMSFLKKPFAAASSSLRNEEGADAEDPNAEPSGDEGHQENPHDLASHHGDAGYVAPRTEGKKRRSLFSVGSTSGRDHQGRNMSISGPMHLTQQPGLATASAVPISSAAAAGSTLASGSLASGVSSVASSTVLSSQPSTAVITPQPASSTLSVAPGPTAHNRHSGIFSGSAVANEIAAMPSAQHHVAAAMQHAASQSTAVSPAQGGPPTPALHVSSATASTAPSGGSGISGPNAAMLAMAAMAMAAAAQDKSGFGSFGRGTSSAPRSRHASIASPGGQSANFPTPISPPAFQRPHSGSNRAPPPPPVPPGTKSPNMSHSRHNSIQRNADSADASPQAASTPASATATGSALPSASADADDQHPRLSLADAYEHQQFVSGSGTAGAPQVAGLTAWPKDTSSTSPRLSGTAPPPPSALATDPSQPAAQVPGSPVVRVQRIHRKSSAKSADAVTRRVTMLEEALVAMQEKITALAHSQAELQHALQIERAERQRLETLLRETLPPSQNSS